MVCVQGRKKGVVHLMEGVAHKQSNDVKDAWVDERPTDLERTHVLGEGVFTQSSKCLARV